jgi:hypothetical protein
MITDVAPMLKRGRLADEGGGQLETDGAERSGGTGVTWPSDFL